MVFWIGMYLLLGLVLDVGLVFGLVYWALYRTGDPEALDRMLDILYDGEWISRAKAWVDKMIINPDNKFVAAGILLIAFILWPGNVVLILSKIIPMVQLILNWKKTGS